MTTTDHQQEATGLRHAISTALAEMPTPKPDAPTALIYARMSMDSVGKELGLTRQVAGEDGALKLCAVRGWTVTEDHIFTDNDLSAASGIFRPGYADLMAAIERGEAGIIVTYQLSRLWRNRRERAEAMEILKTHRVKVVTVKGPELDLATAYGRAMVGLLGEFDTMESDVKGERMRSSILQKAHAGQQSGGGQRPFGYQLRYKIVSKAGEKQRRRITRVSVDPDEGKIVQDCAGRVLAGEPIASIVRDLNDRMILTSAGNPWNRTTLRRMLCSARISGRREHISRDSYETTRPLIGEIVWAPTDDPERVWEPGDNIDQDQHEGGSEPEGDTDEEEPEGTLRWPAIIGVADSDRIRTLLTRPERRLTTGGARKHLLSGILHCARCGQPMVGRSSRGVLRYVCNKNPDGGKAACGGTFITAAPTDDRIRDLVLTALDSPELVARLRHRDQPEPDLHARIRADEDELELWAADQGNGMVSRVEWRKATTPIRARLEAARAQLATSTQTTALVGFVGALEDMTHRWDAANNSQRRAVIHAVVETVTVHPAAVAGRNRFDTARLEPVWRV
ncbi:MAG: recombinase family protein [Pseudonocardiales bacterium]|nr:MAG: recombinase family protein [Pseudonocardiales bacterium]